MKLRGTIPAPFHEESFLDGRTMGEAIVAEREEVVSSLVMHGFKYAPIAARMPSWNDYYRTCTDLYCKDANGKGDGIALRVRRRIISALRDEDLAS